MKKLILISFMVAFISCSDQKKQNEKNRRCRAEATNVFILAFTINVGDGLQRAEEQMGNKNTTLKPWKTPRQNRFTKCPS